MDDIEHANEMGEKLPVERKPKPLLTFGERKKIYDLRSSHSIIILYKVVCYLHCLILLHIHDPDDNFTNFGFQLPPNCDSFFSNSVQVKTERNKNWRSDDTAVTMETSA